MNIDQLRKLNLNKFNAKTKNALLVIKYYPRVTTDWTKQQKNNLTLLRSLTIMSKAPMELNQNAGHRRRW